MFPIIFQTVICLLDYAWLICERDRGKVTEAPEDTLEQAYQSILEKQRDIISYLEDYQKNHGDFGVIYEKINAMNEVAGNRLIIEYEKETQNQNG